MPKRPCFVYGVRMAKRHARRRIPKTLPRIAPPRVAPSRAAERVVIREAPFVERLAYTRSQAAEALGLSRSTFTRRVLPYVETVEMPWGAKLIPVDELERLLAEHRQAANHAQRRPLEAARSWCPPMCSNESELSGPKERASTRSQPASTPTGPRPPTAAHSGGPQPSAPP